MTPKERVKTAISHRQPDRCPWHLDFTVRAHQRMVEHTGDVDFASRIGCHIAGVDPVAPDAWVEVTRDMWRDQFGVIWNRTIDKDIGNPDGAIFPEPSLGGYVWPDPDDERRWEHFGEAVKAAGERYIVMHVGFSLFERAWTMRGMHRLMLDFIDHPGFVEELLDAIVEFNLGLVRRGTQYQVDGVMFGDDWGQQRGMLMGPHLWRQFIKPRLRRMYEAVHAGGKHVVIHSCGDVKEVFPDLIEIGVDVFNPFQPEVIDVFWAKREYGKDLTFFGGVSTQRLLPYGTPREVREQAHRLMDEVGRNGGYIIAPAHAVPGDVPAENMAALIEAVNEQ